MKKQTKKQLNNIKKIEDAQNIILENEMLENKTVSKNYNYDTKHEKVLSTKAIINLIVCFFTTVSACICIYFVYKTNLVICISVLSVLAAAYIILIILSMFKKTLSIAKIFLSCLYFAFILSIILIILKLCGVIEYFSSAEKVRNLILSSGLWGIIIFILLQTAQVVISPIPGMVTIAVGAQVFGPLAGFAYSSIGIILGSFIAFSIGRFFSEKVALLFVSKEDLIKYREKLNKKGKYLLPIIFLFPFFPDDIVCIVAGLTTMKFTYFLVVTLITRPVSILISSYFMSGQIVPFKGWGLIVWGVLILLVAVLFWVVTKYSDKIEDIFLNKKNKKNNAKLSDSSNYADNKNNMDANISTKEIKKEIVDDETLKQIKLENSHVMEENNSNKITNKNKKYK